MLIEEVHIVIKDLAKGQKKMTMNLIPLVNQASMIVMSNMNKVNIQIKTLPKQCLVSIFKDQWKRDINLYLFLIR